MQAAAGFEQAGEGTTIDRQNGNQETESTCQDRHKHMPIVPQEIQLG